MANKAGWVAYCAQCNGYREHHADMGAAGPIGYRCLVCGHPSDPAERCGHAPACVVSGAKAANTPPEMWVRLGEQQGAPVGRAHAERNWRDDRRNRALATVIIGGAALVLILFIVAYAHLN